MTLTDRLLAAIDTREATARATLTPLFVGGNPDRPVGTTSGRWEVRKREFDEQVFVEEVGADTVALASDVDLTIEDWTGLEPAMAQHIAVNDPQAVILMCQAHRELVELHAGEHECRSVHTGTYPADSPPSYGTPGGTWRHVCFEYYDEPCPTLRGIATGYGIEVDA